MNTLLCSLTEILAVLRSSRCSLTCVPELTFAHVFGEYGSVALQLCDNSEVDFDVISSAADAPAEIHLHAAHASADRLQPIVCASFPRDLSVMT